MAKDYKQTAKNARKRAEDAKVSSDNLSRELEKMQQLAKGAADSLEQSKAARQERAKASGRK
jgi:Zn-dependent peptidase ImmA (M78 family)